MEDVMNAGAAIMIVGGAGIWLWGMMVPGVSFATISAVCIGGLLVGLGAPRLYK